MHRTAILALSACAALSMAPMVVAQGAGPRESQAPAGQGSQSGPAVAEPAVVEVLMEVAAEGARCRPPEARLPAGTPVELRLVNSGATPIRFIGTAFLEGSQVEGSSGAVADGEAGYLVGPGVTARIAVTRTPAQGRYPFTCATEQAGKAVEGTGGTFEIVERPQIPVR